MQIERNQTAVTITEVCTRPDAFGHVSASVLGDVNPRISYCEKAAVMKQEECELEPGFMGFTETYHALSLIIPKNCVVIDFGCYLAAQAYFFEDHKKYIGVDVVPLKRFEPCNATHYVRSIQDFIANELDEIIAKYGERNIFAICNYVPDFEATKMVKSKLSNVFCYYP